MTNTLKKHYNNVKASLGLKTNKHMENPLRVQAKVNELNLAEPREGGMGGLLMPQAVSTAWTAVPGYFALTGFNNTGGIPAFNANYGYIVKIFVNSKTGEMKIYPFNLFES